MSLCVCSHLAVRTTTLANRMPSRSCSGVTTRFAAGAPASSSCSGICPSRRSRLFLRVAWALWLLCRRRSPCATGAWRTVADAAPMGPPAANRCSHAQRHGLQRRSRPARGAIAPGCHELERDFPGGVALHATVGKRRSAAGGVVAQRLQPGIEAAEAVEAFNGTLPGLSGQPRVA